MTAYTHSWVGALFASAALAGCGGGGDSSTSSGGTGDPTVSQRTLAAAATAENNAECGKVKPFYWEIGDKGATLASASVNVPGGQVYTAASVMSIASASKWLYSTYFVQKTAGNLTATDVKFFNFKSGYANLTTCSASTTVGNCLDVVNDNGTTNGSFTASAENKFDYDGGHMQKHAALNGLANMDSASLATEIRSQLGSEIALSYGQPQLAGGVFMSASEYGKVLRKILGGALTMNSALGTHAVCASADICPTQAIRSPAPKGESWNYSIGHWVEAPAPAVSDSAFSSPGAFGFYPWIDKTKTYYGIVARTDPAGALDSVDCGRVIRKAWVTATAQ